MTIDFELRAECPSHDLPRPVYFQRRADLTFPPAAAASSLPLPFHVHFVPGRVRLADSLYNASYEWRPTPSIATTMPPIRLVRPSSSSHIELLDHVALASFVYELTILVAHRYVHNPSLVLVNVRFCVPS